VGDGGFSASEFELLQELGQISIQQIDSIDDVQFPTSIDRASPKTQTAVIAYTASYFSGMPFQDPVVTLIKEYLPGAKSVACNELQVLKHLCGMPNVADKWRAAAAPLSRSPPIVELLGYFLAGPSERAMIADPKAQTDFVDADTIWIVQKWENMAPLSMYPFARQTSGLGLGRLFGGTEMAIKQRIRMIRAITRGTLGALAFCHERNVVHGSVGSGSFLLSSFDDQDANRLVVKLDNFGFARRISLPPQSSSFSSSRINGGKQPVPLFPEPRPFDDSPMALGRRGDLRQLAVVLLECILSALAEGAPSERTSTDSVVRLLAEVMEWDMQQFRSFCEDDGELDGAMTLLKADDGAGWDLLHDLVEGKKTAHELAAGKFCLPE